MLAPLPVLRSLQFWWRFKRIWRIATVERSSGNGVHLTLFGAVNAGKSSLLNALARRDVAIVSPAPGTTRDVIEVHLDLGGTAVIVSDTAGLRETTEAVEAEGVRRALARADSADIAVLVLDGSAADPFAGLPPDAASKARLTVWNKADPPWPAPTMASSSRPGPAKASTICSTCLRRLSSKILIAKEILSLLTRARHRHALEQAAVALERALAAPDGELVAEDLRLALRWLGRITGRVDIEELLDVVFRDFCIGK